VTIALTYAVIFCLQHAGRFTNDAVLFVPQSAYEAIAQLVLLDRMNLPVNPGLWTIALQFRWYALFPLFLLLFVKSKRAFYLCLGLAWIGFLFTRARSMDLGTLPLFLLGIVAADLVARRDRMMRYAVWLLPAAVAVALLWDRHAMVPDAWGEESHFIGQPTSFGWHMVAFCLVLAAVRWSPLRAVLSWSPLVALGAASFSIYLVHQPVLAVAQGVAGTGGGMAAFAGSIAAGVALWWGVERPISDPNRRRTMRERTLPALGRAFRFLGLPSAFTVRP
jgi:peptidoglycan/LPS O-acetylase OafA/YrhL